MNAYPSTLADVAGSSIGRLNRGAPPVTSPVDVNEKTTSASLPLLLLDWRYTPPYENEPSVLAAVVIVALSGPVTVTWPVPNVLSVVFPANAAEAVTTIASTAMPSTPMKRFIVSPSGLGQPESAV